LVGCLFVCLFVAGGGVVVVVVVVVVTFWAFCVALRERLPAQNVYWFKCPRHKKRYCLSFLFQFDRPDDEYFFAYSFPYTYTRLQKYLHALEAQNMPHFRRELLCRTTQQRRLDLLKITAPSNLEDSKENRMVRVRLCVCGDEWVSLVLD
jgi:hypothetical protein